ncbi:MAG: hypothetical protein GY941_27185 [Planctomycetes bacterium]|nr:hypothetical protein [Planctomycetota bacterium]
MGEMTSIYETSEVGSIAAVTKLAGFEFTNYFEYMDEGEVIALRGLNVKNGSLNLNDVKFISVDVSKKLPRSKLFKGELVFTYVGTIGQVAIISQNDKFHLAPNVAKLTFNNLGCPDYVFQYLRSDFVNSEYDRLVTTTSQPALSMGNIRKVKVPLPKYKQQQKIAKILTTVDNLIEKTQALIDKYTAIKQGVMADLFTRGIDPSGTPETNPNYGQLRPSYEQAPELYKETELGWVPREWEVQPLGHYLSMITYGFTNPMPETGSGPWMVTAANVVGGVIDYKKTRKTSLEDFNTLLTQKSKPKIGDILLTRDGTLGRLAIVDKENLCINQSVALLRCNESAKPEFIKLLLETERYYQKMLDDAGGSTIKHIYITIVDKMPLAMPHNADEQMAIFTKAKAINDQIETETENLEKFKLVKKGLMQDLLTGKVKVS